MSRKSVWEVLGNIKLDEDDLNLLINDITSFGRTYSEIHIDFAASLGRKNISDLFYFILQLEHDVIRSFLYLSEVFLSFYIFDSRQYGSEGYNFDTHLNALEKRISYYLEALNFSTIVDENTLKVIIISKDTISESVSLIFNEKNDSETSWRILMYKSISISLEEKIDTIRFLYTKLENINHRAKDPRYKNTRRLANYFRHHQADYELVPEIESNKEVYCDLAYDLMMEIFLTAYNDDLYNGHLEIIKKIRWNYGQK